jgi:uncharacterized protein (DUF885 family)
MAELAPLMDEFMAYWWRVHPTLATAAGVHTHDGELERYDPASLAEVVRQSRGYLEKFDGIAPRDAIEALDLELVRGQLRWQLYELTKVSPHLRNPSLYLEAPLSVLYLMAVRDYAPAAERARRATERLELLPATLAEARENLTLVSPVFARTAIAMARSGLALFQGILPLNLGSALEDDQAEFARWENALRGAEAALIAFATWLEEEVTPRATHDFAVGREAFETRVRYLHGLPYSADELLAYGEELKRETELALDELAREIDEGRGWKEIAESLKDDHPAADELIEVYAAEMNRARQFVETRGLVGIPPGESLEVTATPGFLRPLIPYAAYIRPAPFEVAQRGLFFVTSPDDTAAEALRDHPRHGIPVTALHEAYPGHHLQLTWSNRARSLPGRVFWTPVFAEGWALYCEEMMWEEGFYGDPRERLLQLKDLLWRACRIIIDVGLHTRGWSTAEAVAYLVREAGLEPVNAEVEVSRYCAEPTYPMSYAVGKREILRLRDRWRALRGPDAPLREFHDQLLAWGTIPPPLVARAIGLD